MSNVSTAATTQPAAPASAGSGSGEAAQPDAAAAASSTLSATSNTDTLCIAVPAASQSSASQQALSPSSSSSADQSIAVSSQRSALEQLLTKTMQQQQQQGSPSPSLSLSKQALFDADLVHVTNNNSNDKGAFFAPYIDQPPSKTSAILKRISSRLSLKANLTQSQQSHQPQSTPSTRTPTIIMNSTATTLNTAAIASTSDPSIPVESTADPFTQISQDQPTQQQQQQQLLRQHSLPPLAPIPPQQHPPKLLESMLTPSLSTSPTERQIPITASSASLSSSSSSANTGGALETLLAPVLAAAAITSSPLPSSSSLSRATQSQQLPPLSTQTLPREPSEPKLQPSPNQLHVVVSPLPFPLAPLSSQTDPNTAFPHPPAPPPPCISPTTNTSPVPAPAPTIMREITAADMIAPLNTILTGVGSTATTSVLTLSDQSSVILAEGPDVPSEEVGIDKDGDGHVFEIEGVGDGDGCKDAVGVLENGVQDEGEKNVVDMQLPYGIVPAGSMGVDSLKPDFELPVRGIMDFISHKDPITSQVLSTISAWPIRKSGFLFRRDLHPPNNPATSKHTSYLSRTQNMSNYSSLFPTVRPTPSTLSNMSTNSNSSSTGRSIGRSIMALLHSRSRHSHGVVTATGETASVTSNSGATITGGGVHLDTRSASITSTFSTYMSPADDEEDWGLYYVEVRGRYMMFYLVTPPQQGANNSIPAAATQAQVPLPPPPPSPSPSSSGEGGFGRRLSSGSVLGSVREGGMGSGGGGAHQGKRPSNQMSFGSLKEAVKPQIGFNKIFDSISKRTKAAAQHLYNQNLKRPSSSDLRLRVTNSSPIPPASISLSGGSNLCGSVGGVGPGVGAGSVGNGSYQPPANASERRNSNDSVRSLWSTLSPDDVKNAPKTLIHYIPLHLSSLEYVFTRTSNSPLYQTFSEVPAPQTTYPSYLSLSVRVGVPSPLDTNPFGTEERLMLDIVDELTWDWTSAFQHTTNSSDTVTSQTVTTKPTPSAKKLELDAWVDAVRVGSLLAFDPMVSTYGVWEQQQLQAMSRAATNASTGTAKASVMNPGGGGGGSGGGGFIHRSLTRLSFGQHSSAAAVAAAAVTAGPVVDGLRASPTLTVGTMVEGGSGSWWPGGGSVKHRRDSFVLLPGAAGAGTADEALLGTSPSTGLGLDYLNHKPSFAKIFKTRKPTNSSIDEPAPSLASGDLLKPSEIKVGLSTSKRQGISGGEGDSQLRHQKSNSSSLRGVVGYKPTEPSPLSPVPPKMAPSQSAFSWHDRGKVVTTGLDPSASLAAENGLGVAAAPNIEALPFPKTDDLQIKKRGRAMSHGVSKITGNAPETTHSDGRTFLSFFKKDATTALASVNGQTIDSTDTGKTAESARKAASRQKATAPSRPSLLSFGFGNGSANANSNVLMRRTATTLSNSSSMRKVPAKGNKDKRLSTSTFLSGNGTYRSGVELSGDVPLVLRKCIKLIEEIGLEVEGLYRISGSSIAVQKLERLFEVDPTRVHLHPPPDSQILATLSSPFISDSPVPKRRQESRLSWTDTISSSRSSFDAEALAALAAGPMSKILDAGRSNNPERWRNGGGSDSGAALLIDTKPTSPKGADKPPPAEPPRGGRKIKRGFNKPDVVIPNSAASSGSLYDNDVHVVTNVVKAFLRKGLPPKMEPPTTYDFYDAFIAAALLTEWRDRMIAIQDLIHQLPTENFETLKFLFLHLHRVSTFSASNKMGVKNLSIIFGPNLLRPAKDRDTLQRELSDMPHKCAIAEIMIEYAEWVFGPIEFVETAPSIGAGDSKRSNSGNRVTVAMSDRASMVSEDESYAPLRKFYREGGGRSSRDVFNPAASFRNRFSDAEKDSVDDILDLIPREDMSSRIPDDSVRESFEDDESSRIRFGDYDNDSVHGDNDSLFDAESFNNLPGFPLTNRQSCGTQSGGSGNGRGVSESLSRNNSLDVGLKWRDGESIKAASIISEGGLLISVDISNANDFRRSVEMNLRQVEEKKQRRRGTVMLSGLPLTPGSENGSPKDDN